MKVKRLNLDEDFLMELENPTPIRSVTHFCVGDYALTNDCSRVKLEFLFSSFKLLPNLFLTFLRENFITKLISVKPPNNFFQ